MSKNLSEKNKKRVGEEQTFYIDLGNFSYKLIYDHGTKKATDFSNAEEVKDGTYDSFKINGKSYIFGPNARIKYDTNKICEEKKALLGRALYPVVQDKEKIKVVTLLPLSLYLNTEDKNREAFSDLLKGKYTVSNPSGYEKTFTVTDVEVCCESFSSIVTEKSIRNKPSYLVDLGGVDWTGVFIYKRPDENKRFNNTSGMNAFYSKLGSRLTSKFRKTYTPLSARLTFEKYSAMEESTIEKMKDEKEKTRSTSMKNIIDEFSREYIKKNIYDELYRIDYDEDIHELVFAGGGAEALKKYLEEDVNAKILKDAVFTNVEGAKILSIEKSRIKKMTQTQKKGTN